LISKNKVLILCLLLLSSLFALPAIVAVESQTTTPLFHMTLIVPGANPSRKAWGEIVQNNLKSVGIDAARVELPFSPTVYDRALDPNASSVGLTYDQGGFDALFVGYAMNIPAEPFSLFHSSQMPPGQNYYLWNNSENDRLCSLIEETVDQNTRLDYVKQWQQLAYTEQPCATIMYTQEVVAYNPNKVQGPPFQAYHYPIWPGVEKWTLVDPAKNTVVLAQTGECPGEGLNPWLSTSYYDSTAIYAIFDGLATWNSTIDKKVVPSLATDWSVASDQKTWTVHLRKDVKWQDGVPFTAADVKFTYDNVMKDELASQPGAFVKSIFGSSDNVKVIDDYTLEFDLPKPYAYFVETILTQGYGSPLPKHVLENVPLADWKTHPFNTASGSYKVGSYTAYGPIGTGPYIYSSHDATTLSNKLTKNDNYWNKAALEAQGLFGIKTYYVQQILDSTPAIAALKSGDVDVLDSQYHLENQLSSFDPSWGKYVSYDAFGVQELGFNMKHPVLGTGVDTPLGKQDPSRAAEAARYVRQAISHLIPREQIISSITHGYGTPGVTTAVTKVTAGFDTSLQPYTFDVNLAKSLLAAAGYNTGVAPPTADIWGQYGLYIIVIVVVVIIAVVGAVVWRMRTKKKATSTVNQP
jgi:peptide/nickel transport system substrate-binding protein